MKSRMKFHEFEVRDMEGNNVSLSKYKGRVLLVVNVASKCGFTPQYEGLEALYQKYKEEGFMVLAFPSNQFLSQEPESNENIKLFCQSKYDVSFDMFAKIDVNGANADPLFSFLKEQQGGIFGTSAIKWNFTKFLVDDEGSVIKRYGSAIKPQEIEADIEKLLAK